MAEINRVRMEETADIDAARSELNRIDSRIDKLVMAIADGADALPLNTKIKELETRQHELQGKVDNASDPEPLIHPNLRRFTGPRSRTYPRSSTTHNARRKPSTSSGA